MGIYKSKTWGRCPICDFSFDTESEFYNGLATIESAHWWGNNGTIRCSGCETTVDYSDIDNIELKEPASNSASIKELASYYYEQEQIELKNLIEQDFDE